MEQAIRKGRIRNVTFDLCNPDRSLIGRFCVLPKAFQEVLKGAEEGRFLISNICKSTRKKTDKTVDCIEEIGTETEID